MFTKIMQKRKNVLFTVKGRTRTGIKPIAILEKNSIEYTVACEVCQHILLVKRISNDLGKKREPVQNE